MRKLLFLFFLSLYTGFSNAAEPQSTTDKFVISDLTVAPGGDEAFFTVSLEGSRIYTAYNLDIHLPEGLEVVYDEDNAIKVYMNATPMVASPFYPSTKVNMMGMNFYNYPHSLACSYGVVATRQLRVAVSSDSNDNFLTTSGDLFTVYVKASPYMKPGTAKITIDGQNLTVKENAQKYVPAPYEKDITVSTTSKVALNINAANQWSTCVLPFNAAIPTGVTAYECDHCNGDALALTAAESFEAYTPYILYAPAGYSNTLTGEVDPSKYVEVATKGILSGAIVPQSISAGYVMQKKEDTPMFYHIENGDVFSIPSGRCWLHEDANLSAGRFTLDSETLGITNAEVVPSSAVIYDLQGRRVSEARGMVIENKKKTIK